jgi:predicted nucleic acid-binding protein
VSDLVIDASLALQWFLEDEAGREYGLAILRGLADKRAVVPPLWFYEVGNGLVMAYPRKRITSEQLSGFVIRLKTLPNRRRPPDADGCAGIAGDCAGTWAHNV